MEHESYECEDCGYEFESFYSEVCPLCDVALHKWNEDSINENMEAPDLHRDYNHWKNLEGKYIQQTER